jgi:phosphate-selective porin OprO and OprP
LDYIVGASMLSYLPILLLAQMPAGGSPAPDVTPPMSSGGGTALVRSEESRVAIRVGAVVQFDGRLFAEPAEQNLLVDQFVLRRGGPLLEAVVLDRTKLRLLMDFGQGRPSVLDAYAEYEVASWLRIRAGKQKPPVGLERLLPPTRTLFVERAFPSNLVPVRDIGAQLLGDLWKLHYAVGVFNGVPDGAMTEGDVEDAKEVATRLLANPFAHGSAWLKGISVGAAMTNGRMDAVTAGGAPLRDTWRYSSDGLAGGRRRRTNRTGGDRARLCLPHAVRPTRGTLGCA